MLEPQALRAHYRHFLRDDRVLLTGHSHQAWPDVALEGLTLAFADAAAHVDDKWGAAAQVAEALREGIAARIGAAPREIALGQSTHELASRFVSALPLRERPHLVTTGGEFHSLRRQLQRLQEAGVEVTWVAPAPAATLAARLAEAIREDTAALLCSTVLFETSTVVPGLAEAIARAHERGAEVLLDAYHAFGVVPFSLAALGAQGAFVTAGGYKYAQWGEGCCWLRVPSGCALRPVYTGWFAEFATLGQAPSETVAYGADGADRFAGSTYDPSSHYRARAVLDFFDAQGMSVEALRGRSLSQTARLIERLEALDVVTPREDASRGGFVAVRIESAARVVEALRREGIFVDARGDLLRLGPAPYVSDESLDRAADALLRLTTSDT